MKRREAVRIGYFLFKNVLLNQIIGGNAEWV